MGLKDTYFTVLIDSGHHQFLISCWMKNATSSHASLSAYPLPPHFHQTDQAGDDISQIVGVRIIVYIDNMLILAEIPEQATQHLDTLLWTLQSLGFIINPEKSMFTPAQEIEFLSLVTDSQSMELSLPGEKLR